MKAGVILSALIVAACSMTPVFAAKPSDWKESASISAMLTQKEQDWGLPIGMAHCQAYKESRFEWWVVSPDGQDRGLFQINKEHEAELVEKYFREPDGTKRTGFDWRNPEHSATVGCGYLAAMTRKFGGSNWLGLVAYNWGPGHLSRIKKWADIPVKKRKYANDVLALLDEWSPEWAEGGK